MSLFRKSVQVFVFGLSLSMLMSGCARIESIRDKAKLPDALRPGNIASKITKPRSGPRLPNLFGSRIEDQQVSAPVNLPEPVVDQSMQGNVLAEPIRIPVPTQQTFAASTPQSALQAIAQQPLQPTLQPENQPSFAQPVQSQTSFSPSQPLSSVTVQPIQIAPSVSSQPVGQRVYATTYPSGTFPESTFSGGTIGGVDPNQLVGTQSALQQQIPASAPRGAKAKVALLLPTGASGEIGHVARQMRNAALLGRTDAGSVINLSFYDTQGTGSGASSAAQKALNEGAELILGPLMGSNVSSVVSQAASRGVNVVGFSNDMAQAQPNAFLLGIAPDLSVSRVMSYAASKGLRRVAVLAPNSAYGRRALQAARNASYSTGANIVGPYTYAASSGSDDRKSAAKALAEAEETFDAILIADTAKSAREMAALLVFNQVDTSKKQVMGTDQLSDASVQGEAGLRGAWYASTPLDQWSSFRSTYASRFGSSPEKVAGIAYDGAKLASELASSGRNFSGGAIAKSAGFQGLFGGYRLNSSGRPSRSMNIFQINSGSASVIDRASGFTGL